MSNDIYMQLRTADMQGLAPPQNWTTAAADEIQRLRSRLHWILQVACDGAERPVRALDQIEDAAREALEQKP